MEQHNPFDPKTDVVERLAFARQLFRADVNAMTVDQLAATCGGESRCGFDFIYELTGFFDTFGKLLANGPGDIEGPSGGWVRAPLENREKVKSMAELESAADGFVSTLNAYSGSFVSDVFASPVGPFTPLAMANLAVWHMMYHSGQLNYIQTVQGDAGFHWVPEAQ